jgi:steroid delta-isomerase
MSTPTEQTIAEYFAAIRAMDVERWVNTFTPDATSHDPVGTPPKVGHDALRAFLASLTTSYKSVDLTEVNTFVCGLSAAVKWNGHVETHGGKHVDFEGIDVIDTNEEGKITLVRAFWDPTAVMAARES